MPIPIDYILLIAYPEYPVFNEEVKEKLISEDSLRIKIIFQNARDVILGETPLISSTTRLLELHIFLTSEGFKKEDRRAYFEGC
ncbi:MAG: hypothetical protein LVR00_08285 [Rhabdochlamydiaceae bacterium]|jgi:hypothetical protein